MLGLQFAVARSQSFFTSLEFLDIPAMGGAITHCVTSFLVSKATASVVRRFQSHFVFISCSWTPITWAVLSLTTSLCS